jgi:hypothetical protein
MQFMQFMQFMLVARQKGKLFFYPAYISNDRLQGGMNVWIYVLNICSLRYVI